MPTGDWSGQVQGAGLWSEAAFGGLSESVNSSVLHSGVTGQTRCVGTLSTAGTEGPETWNFTEPELGSGSALCFHCV